MPVVTRRDGAFAFPLATMGTARWPDWLDSETAPKKARPGAVECGPGV